MATATKERPILFSTPMVNAILSGSKTQTRRVAKPQPETMYESLTDTPTEFWLGDNRPLFAESFAKNYCKFGRVGDHLWVRETWAHVCECDHFNHLHSDKQKAIYKADGATCPSRWRPSIHMPRWASRITLEIEDVRIERLQQITEADAEEEGFSSFYIPAYVAGGEIIGPDGRDGIDEFANLWEDLNGPRGFGWNANPWVWVVSFKRLEPTT